MIYSWDVTTPANTAETSPQRTVLKVTKGLVYRVEIEFPPGPLGYCYCVICDGGYQVWPSNSNMAFHGDNGYITFEETYLKAVEPFEFTAVTWNIDDTYEHTITIRIGLVSNPVFMARFLPTMTYDKMLQVLAQIQAQQEQQREEIIANPFEWLGEEKVTE